LANNPILSSPVVITMGAPGTGEVFVHSGGTIVPIALKAGERLRSSASRAGRNLQFQSTAQAAESRLT
jgi:hypothetical protein